MAKETCSSCNVRLLTPASFCPACNRPTRHATDQELLEYDLKSWRAHVERSVANGGTRTAAALAEAREYVPVSAERLSRPAGAPSRAVRIEQSEANPAPRARVKEKTRRDNAPTPEPEAPRVKTPKAPRVKTPKAPRVRVPKARSKPMMRLNRLRIRLPKGTLPSRETDDRVITLDTDNPFAYSSCTHCARTDWIVRTKHNEDDTWMYWCVRCSRSFKTERRLNHAVKPFVAGGSVIGLLLTASQLMLR
jgi:hypothetical protein